MILTSLLVATSVPRDVSFSTKPRLAAEMIKRAIAAGVRFRWVATDSFLRPECLREDVAGRAGMCVSGLLSGSIKGCELPTQQSSLSFRNLRSRPVRAHEWKSEQASRFEAFLRRRRHDPILVEIVNVTEMNRVHRPRGISRVQDNWLGESA